LVDTSAPPFPSLLILQTKPNHFLLFTSFRVPSCPYHSDERKRDTFGCGFAARAFAVLFSSQKRAILHQYPCSGSNGVDADYFHETPNKS